MMKGTLTARRGRNSFVRAWLRTGITAVVASLMAACGGGGDEGTGTGPQVTGTGFASASGPGDTASYVPSTVGNQWVFDTSGGEGGLASDDALTTLTLTGTRRVSGAGALVFEESTTAQPEQSLESYLGVRAGGVTRLGDNDATDPITPLITPYVELAFPVATGNVSTVQAVRLPVGTDDAGNPLTARLTQRIDNVGFEAVTVPAGAFANALKQVTTIDGAVVDEALQMEVPFTAIETRWLVPGVGMVKRATEGNSPVIDSLRRSDELRGYTVDGVTHGLGLPFDVAAALGPSDVSPNPPGAEPAIATDGDRFLVVSRRATTNSYPYGMRWQSTLVARDGTVLATADVGTLSPIDSLTGEGTQRAAVAHDGQGYVVVYGHDNAVLQSPSMVAVRVSADGVPMSTPQTLTTGRVHSPVLAYDGARLLLAFVRQDVAGRLWQVRGLFLSPATLAPEGSEFAVSQPGSPTSPAIAYGGGRYLVTWNQYGSSDQSAGVFGRRVAADGSMPDWWGAIALSTTTAACCVDHLPAVRFDGTRFLVAWRDFRQQQDNLHTNIRIARVSPDGMLLDGPASAGGLPVTTALDASEGAPRLAAGPDGETLVVWSVMPSTQALWDLRMARWLPDGGIVASSALGTPMWRRDWIMHPVVAGHDGGAMVAWVAGSAGGNVPERLEGMPVHRFGR